MIPMYAHPPTHTHTHEQTHTHTEVKSTLRQWAFRDASYGKSINQSLLTTQKNPKKTVFIFFSDAEHVASLHHISSDSQRTEQTL